MIPSLQGLGLALPEGHATQASALALARRMWPYPESIDRVLEALYRRTGVATRNTILDLEDANPLVLGASQGTRIPTTAQRMASFDEFAPPLAALASERALADAAIDAAAITHLVTVSCTGVGAPGLDIELIERLSLRHDIARTHVGFMGCYGALAGLRVAAAFAAVADARVLLCATELSSLHFHYGDDPERIVANALFADGSGAAVIAATGRGFQVLGSGSYLFSASRDAMAWRVGDHGFEMTLSPRIPELIEGSLRGWVEEWLARHDTRLADIEHFVIHPGGPRILHAVEAALALNPRDTALSHAVLREHGNMSSPTVLFILDRLRRSRARGRILALAFGPGLVAEATLLEA